jgi:chromosomal replication initiator protein
MLSPAVSQSRELARIWSTVSGGLQLALPAYLFITWVKGTAALTRDGDTLVVEAPSPINCDWLRSKRDEILPLLAAAAGAPLEVRFVPRGASRAPAHGHGLVDMPAVVGTLNSHYTFERYVCGEGNRVAYDWCNALLDPGEQSISPITIWGPPGLGKTHLLHALARAAQGAGWPVACLSAEEFTTRYLGGIRDHDTSAFQAGVRGARLLIVDDLQYLCGNKKGTQDELVHTIDAVTNAGGYAVVGSEGHPADLGLPDRLSSRLVAGLVTRVEPFGLEERRAYAGQLSRERRVALPSWAVERIALLEVPSVRALQGAVHGAIALASCDRLDARRLDAELTRLSVAEAARGRMTDRELLERVAAHFEISCEELTGRSRRGGVREARAAAVASLVERGRPVAEVARLFAGRDPSTVTGLVERGRRLLAEDGRLRQQLAG